MAQLDSASTFEQVSRQLSSHIRNPEGVAAPAGVELRRVKIYEELFYNNIENFISTGFPILRSILCNQHWHAMVRDFMNLHRSQTPYFLEISQEFLQYLQTERSPQSLYQADDPAFLMELAHYEWVEVALDIAETDLADIAVDPAGDLLSGVPVVSPLAWSLAYQYPVHLIGEDYQPSTVGEQPTYLVVYRNRQDEVHFMEANAVTARLLELLQQEQGQSGRVLLEQIAEEMQHPQPALVVDAGAEILQQLLALDIILGSQQQSS